MQIRPVHIMLVLRLSFAALAVVILVTAISHLTTATGQSRTLIQAANLIASDAAAGEDFGFSVAIDADTAVIGGARNDSNAGSAYIFKRDASGNWSQEQELTPQPSSAAVTGLFGISVAISGDVAVVGARDDDTLSPVVSGAGAAYVFVRNAQGTWIQQQRLTANDPGTGDQFGRSVAISGDTIVVGANGVDLSGSPDPLINAGAVYVFTRNSSTSWSQLQKLTASDPGPGFSDYFGWSVAINSSTILVGAPFKKFSSAVGDFPENGASYLFIQSSSGNWVQHQKLLPSIWDIKADNRFGYSVSISGDTLAVGAWEMVIGTGAVYVFVRDTSGNWALQQKLTACDGARGDAFGYSVAISGNTFVAGAFEATLGTTSAPILDAGAAYVFKRGQTGHWDQQEKLTATNPAADDLFGDAVALSGETILVGAYMDDVTTSSGAITDAGSVYVFAPESCGQIRQEGRKVGFSGGRMTRSTQHAGRIKLKEANPRAPVRREATKLANPRASARREAIPQDLVGDWESQGARYRFDYDGNYSIVGVGNYSLQTEQSLCFNNELYVRRSGTSGLVGVWRLNFDSAVWLELTLGPYGYYVYEWNDGAVGSGYYSATGNQLALVEQRAEVEANGNAITFTSSNGSQSGTFTITGNRLVITFPDAVVEYRRVPFW